MKITQPICKVALVLLLCSFGAPRAAFKHPGILVDKASLDFVAAQIKAGTSPWKAAFDIAVADSFADLNWQPKPVDTVVCGPKSRPDIGCWNEKDDATVAYTDALLWAFTGNEAYAKKSIEVMNAWSAVLKAHTNSNAPLQAGWIASVFPRAAEIIRYTYSGWAASDIERFSAMLNNAVFPYIKDGDPTSNGNWELAMIEGMMNIAIFTDNQAMFDMAVAMWRKRVPAYFYLTADGPDPIPPPGGKYTTSAAILAFWVGPTDYFQGQAQETCRDFGHTQFGIASTINAAETALRQGLDLYGSEVTRITAAMEFHAAILMGNPAPAKLCNGVLNVSNQPHATWEVAYNHYHNRAGLDLPWTKKLVEEKARPTGVDHMSVWETLTHAETGSVGVTALSRIPKHARDVSRRLTLEFSESGEPIRVVRRNPDREIDRGETEYYDLRGALISPANGLLPPRHR